MKSLHPNLVALFVATASSVTPPARDQGRSEPARRDKFETCPWWPARSRQERIGSHRQHQEQSHSAASRATGRLA